MEIGSNSKSESRDYGFLDLILNARNQAALQ